MLRQLLYISTFVIYVVMAVALIARAFYGQWCTDESLFMTFVYLGAASGCMATCDTCIERALKHLKALEEKEKA